MKIANLLLSFAAVAALAAGCSDDDNGGGETPPVSGDLTITADPAFIVVGGESTLTVRLGKTDVTSDAKIYMDEESTPMTSNKFTATAEGTHSFWASYDDKTTVRKASVTVLAETPGGVPDDPQPSNTKLHRRVLALQVTGTSCTYCPNLIAPLAVLEETIGEKFCHVGLHGSYGGTDAFYKFNGPSQNVQAYLGVNGAPALLLNLKKQQVAFNSNLQQSINMITDKINREYGDGLADAGIAATTTVSGNTVVVTAEVKAAVTTGFTLDCWLVENGLYAKQTGTTNSEYYTHNHVLRSTYGTFTRTAWNPYLLGAINAGKTKEAVFTFETDPSWKLENCQVVLIVSSLDTSGGYSVANCAYCPVGGSVPYEYAE